MATHFSILPEESHGQRSLGDFSPRGRRVRQDWVTEHVTDQRGTLEMRWFRPWKVQTVDTRPGIRATHRSHVCWELASWQATSAVSSRRERSGGSQGSLSSGHWSCAWGLHPHDLHCGAGYYMVLGGRRFSVLSRGSGPSEWNVCEMFQESYTQICQLPVPTWDQGSQSRAVTL